MTLKKAFQRSKVLSILLTVAMVLTSFGFPSVRGEAAGNYTTLESLGLTDDYKGLAHYNGIILNDYQAQRADVEGALAVGGNTDLGYGEGQFDIGAAGGQMMGDYNPKLSGLPVFLMGFNGEDDKLYIGKNGGWGAVNVDGPAVMKQSVKDYYDGLARKLEKATIYTAEDDLIDSFFDNVRKIAVNLLNLCRN